MTMTLDEGQKLYDALTYTPKLDESWASRTRVTQLPDLETTAALVEAIGPNGSEHLGRSRGNWYGGTYKDYLKGMREGADDDVVDRIDKTMIKFETANLLTGNPDLWEPSVVGPLVDVPATLAGHPENMLAKTGITQSARGELRVVINTVSSAGVSKKEIEDRGALLAALILLLSAARPVRVSILQTRDFSRSKDIDATLLLTDLGTSPLNVATMAYALTSPTFTRRGGFALGEYEGKGVSGSDSISWPWGMYRDDTDGEFASRLRLSLDIKEDDIIFPGFRLYEAGTDPEMWIKEQLAKHAPDHYDQAA